jgi:ATP phosphoribosyltransferase
MNKLTVVIPKGRIYKNVFHLLNEAGIRIDVDERMYRPIVNNPEIEIKIMKPQNIPKLLELGSHDIGFTGLDWIVESGASVHELMDLRFDPVKLVAAIPEKLDEEVLLGRRIIVASEYENIPREFLDKRGFNYVFLRTYGATEVFPPDDADMIIDNTSTGRTLTEHQLKIVANIMDSSTRFVANKDSLADPWKHEKISRLVMLFQSILDARERVILEMNIPSDRMEEIVQGLPCMRSPTVAPLHGSQGYAVKIAIKKQQAVDIIPQLKRMGATDILEYEIRKVVV